jgi:hypothetical protein
MTSNNTYLVFSLDDDCRELHDPEDRAGQSTEKHVEHAPEKFPSDPYQMGLSDEHRESLMDHARSIRERQLKNMSIDPKEVGLADAIGALVEALEKQAESRRKKIEKAREVNPRALALWSYREESRLKQMWLTEHKSLREITAELERSEKSVIERLRLLGVLDAR